MKKYSFTIIALVLSTLILPSCNRSTGEVWEDTKTCGRYVGKGFKSLLGKHADSGEIAFEEQQAARAYASQDVDFISLKDEESYPQSSFGEYNSYSSSSSAYPQSQETPGDPGSNLPGIDGFYTPSGELAAVFNTLYFETDNYSVRGQDNLATIQKIARYLKSHPNTYVFVEGHADERGAAAYNLALGAKRSNSVRSYLIQDGVNLDQIFTISYGKERPLAFGHDDQAWSLNRRAQFKIYTK